MSLVAFLLSSLILVVDSLQDDHSYFPVFQFGDSLSDTGNSLVASPKSAHDLVEPPYGMTFFHHPAARESDGRLVIDFLVTSFGLPMLNPYLRFGDTNYLNGVNFAVSGAPALSFEFYKEHNMSYPANTFALATQVEWFLKIRQNDAQQGRFPDALQFSRGLYIVGEIGGDDYAIMDAFNGLSFSQMLDLVPYVIESVEKHIRSLSDAGARRFLVVNIPLQGCSPSHLVTAKPNEEKDRFGCIAGFNKIIAHHNSLLKVAVQQLREELANSSISYADFYGIHTAVLENPQAYGFHNRYIPCCGTYTNEQWVHCGQTKVIDGIVVTGKACSNPSDFMYWNDGHFTDHFNNIVANAFVSGQYLDPPLPLDHESGMEFPVAVD